MKVSILALLMFLHFSCRISGGFSSRDEQTLANILRGYSNNPRGVGFTIATNQPASERVPVGPPTTWAVGNLQKLPSDAGGGIVSNAFTLGSPYTVSNRYWSNRLYHIGDYLHPFDPNDTDYVKLQIQVMNSDVQMTLIKNEADGSNTYFSVEIYGFLTGANGHLIYGRYGGFNGLFSVSLW